MKHILLWQDLSAYRFYRASIHKDDIKSELDYISCNQNSYRCIKLTGEL